MGVEIKQVFNIENPRQMIMGSILIDTNENAGWEPSMNKLKCDYKYIEPYLSLRLFPAGMKISDSVEDNGLLFTESWFNGFAYPCTKIYTQKNVKDSCIKWLNTHGFITLSQELTAKSPQYLNPIFAHMSWYKNPTKRLSDILKCDPSRVDRLIKSGIICSHWKADPVQIRYIIKKEKIRKEDTEFIYFIGGSTDVLEYENYSKIMPKITECARSLLSFKKSNSQNHLKNVMCDCFIEWCSNKSKKPYFADKQLEKNWSNIQYFYRFCTFINLTRNFFIYAQKILGEKNYTIYELNGESNKVAAIDTKEVIDRLDEMYQFLKTTILVYHRM